MSKNSKYIHGATPSEQDRLSLLNTLLNKRCLNQLNLKGGEKILDFGSGLGQFSRAMAKASGQKVIGIERDEQQLTSAKQYAKQAGENNLVEFRQGDVFNPPLEKNEWGTFDVVHTRFLLEHLRDPRLVVDKMLEALRPGGRIVLMDDDHATFQCTPAPLGYQTIWEAYCRSYERLGNDPYIGRRLVSMLHRAGAAEIQNRLVFFGGCAGNPDFDAYVTNVIGILEGAKALMLKEALIDERTFNGCIRELEKWGRFPDAALWYGACWAEGIRTSA